jgi:hypothetical protein
MTEELNKNPVQYIIKEIQPILSISYIIAIGIGMLFNYQKFSEYGINIFEYSDILDFLIAPFADFLILFFTIVSLALAYLFFQLDLYWERKYPKFYSKMVLGLNARSWYNYVRYSSYLILFILYLYLAADLNGKLARSRSKEKPEIVIKFDNNEIEKGIMIGKTKEIIFLLKGEDVKAIPITSLVKEFDIK